MTIESGSDNTGTGGSDQTTSAVFDVIRTMHGEGVDATKPDSSPTAAAELNEHEPSASQPPERLNVNLEERLVDLGVFNRRSMAQRRVLGCVGCKLATRPGNTGEVQSSEIAQCTGMYNSGVRRILARLTTGGFLKTEKKEEDALKGKPPDYFRLTGRAVQFAFKRSLEVPTTCGQKLEGGQYRANAEGEQLLIDAGIFDIRGSTPRAILGCLACKLEQGEGVHVKGLRRCAGVPASHSLKVLRRMVEGGFLKAERHDGGVPCGQLVTYTPADTELAQKIVESLEKPAQCGLEEK